MTRQTAMSSSISLKNIICDWSLLLTLWIGRCVLLYEVITRITKANNDASASIEVRGWVWKEMGSISFQLSYQNGWVSLLVHWRSSQSITSLTKLLLILQDLDFLSEEPFPFCYSRDGCGRFTSELDQDLDLLRVTSNVTWIWESDSFV